MNKEDLIPSPEDYIRVKQESEIRDRVYENELRVRIQEAKAHKLIIKNMATYAMDKIQKRIKYLESEGNKQR